MDELCRAGAAERGALHAPVQGSSGGKVKNSRDNTTKVPLGAITATLEVLGVHV